MPRLDPVYLAHLRTWPGTASVGQGSDEKVLLEVMLFIPEGGRRGRGRPRLRFYDTVKADLSVRGVVVNARQQEDF